ncbi:MAG: hypothetical protein WC551_08980 [Patescibacteria group bacterium]
MLYLSLTNLTNDLLVVPLTHGEAVILEHLYDRVTLLTNWTDEEAMAWRRRPDVQDLLGHEVVDTGYIDADCRLTAWFHPGDLDPKDIKTVDTISPLDRDGRLLFALKGMME